MQSFYTLSREQQNTAIALGYFDGVHRGHRSVLCAAAQEQKNGLLPVCLTFAESPKSVITGVPSQTLMTPADKQNALGAIGIKHVYFADFRAMMNLSAKEFFEQILLDTLNAKKLFCGFNYRFGRNGEGDTALLQKLCDSRNIALTVAPLETDGGEIICSTLIKSLIIQGNIRRANTLLQTRFGFSGEITHGNKLGRELGTPTINQKPADGLIIPKFGVYASAVTLENGDTYCGVTNVGIKPTVGGTAPLWETWMPRYTGGELYGQTADVRLLDFIRPETKFENIEALGNEIKRNGQTALAIFAREFI